MNYSIKKVVFRIKNDNSTKLIPVMTKVKIYIDNKKLKCKIIRHLGYGTVGNVYLLENPFGDNNQYIIKISNSNSFDDLKNEIRLMKKNFQKHKIVHKLYPLYYGYIKSLKRLGVIYPYLGNSDLEQIKYSNHKIDFQNNVYIIKQIMKQLSSFNNVIHGDLKPANVVINTNNNEVNIIDFGLLVPIDDCEDIISTCYVTSPESLLSLIEYNHCLTKNDKINFAKHDNYGLFSIVINLFTKKGMWDIISTYLVEYCKIDRNIFKKSNTGDIFVYCWYKFFGNPENKVLDKLISSIETYYPELKSKNFMTFEEFYIKYIVKNIDRDTIDFINLGLLNDFIKNLIMFDYNKRLSINELLNHKFIN